MAPVFDPDRLVEAIEGPRISIPFALIHNLGGDFQAAAFLSQSAYFSALSKGKEGWFDLKVKGASDPYASNIFSRAGSWEALLGLGKDAQRAVRKRLVGLGLLEERREGIPARTKYRVDSAAYLAFLTQENHQSAEIRQLDGGKLPTSESKPADLMDGDPPTIPNNSSTEFSKKNTTTGEDGSSGNGEETLPPEPDHGNGLDGLEIEDCLTQHLPTLTLPHLLLQEVRQQILDELAGAVRAGNIVERTPARYLVGLVKRYQAGEFKPDLARKVAADRVKRAANAAALAAARSFNPAKQEKEQGPSGSCLPGGSAKDFLAAAGIHLHPSQTNGGEARYQKLVVIPSTGKT